MAGLLPAPHRDGGAVPARTATDPAADGAPVPPEFPERAVPDPRRDRGLTGHDRQRPPAPAWSTRPCPALRSPTRCPTPAVRRITDYANRADPYPLYAKLREAGVARQADGSYVVGTYHEIAALLHDPRISSDRRNLLTGVPPGCARADGKWAGRRLHRTRRPRARPAAPHRDAPLRPAASPTGSTTHPALEATSPGSSTASPGKERIDLVDDFAYPLPVTVICRLLGVPRGCAAVQRVGRHDHRDSVGHPTPEETAGGDARDGAGRLVHGRSRRASAAPSPSATCSPPWPTTTAPTGASLGRN